MEDTKSGPVLRRGRGAQFSLYNGDGIGGMTRQLEPGTVDVVVTSPPYTLGTAYREYDDTMERGDYIQWIGKWAAAVKGVLAEGGSLFLNVGGKPSDPWVPFEVASELRRHFALQNVIHWVKSIAIQKEDTGRYPGLTGNVSVGHFKPINSPRFLNDCHEYIFHFTKEGRVPLDRLAVGVEYQDKSNVGRWDGAKSDRRCRGNTWFVPYKTIRSRAKQRPHPATFPAKIPQMCIQLHGLEQTRLVLDPFMGIGSTAQACAALGVDCIGFEIDRGYFDESLRLLDRTLEADDGAAG